MAASLSNLVHNVVEGIYKIKCNCSDYFHEYKSIKDNSRKYKCLSSDKTYSKKMDKFFLKKDLTTHLSF